MNHLYFGDNLDVLRRYIPDESVDLIYLDPPFNSNRNYSVIFNRNGATDDEAAAQIEAFEDTWRWTTSTDEQLDAFRDGGPGRAVDTLTAFLSMLGKNDAMAYLVNMAPRIVELHRVLKSTGSLYLHCDSTMSHYLKVLLDSIFDARNFRNEIIWKRTTGVKGNSGQGARHYGRSTDTILYYVKTKDAPYYQQYSAYSEDNIAKQFKYVEEETGRRYSLDPIDGPGGASKGNAYYELMGVSGYWRYSKEVMDKLVSDGRIIQTKPGNKPRRKKYLDEGKGVSVSNLWADLPNLQASSAEALGYPTQKPLSLLERIIETSSRPGDVILDPFSGCGTAVDAAQKTGRRWIGIDVTYISIDLMVKRLQHTYGDAITSTFKVTGIPHDVAAARAMFSDSAFEFERWAVTLVGAQPNQKQVGDKGIDGVGRFVLSSKKTDVGRILVSVKGGKTINPSMARDLAGTVHQQGAELGILVTLEPATRGVQEVIDQSGYWTHPANGVKYPVLQHFTIQELLKGARPNVPPMYAPYIEAKKQRPTHDQSGLF